MPQILRPLDWQRTSSRPLISLDRSDTPGALRILVAPAEQYFKGPFDAPPAFSASIAAEDASIANVRVGEPLDDGAYVVFAVAEEAPTTILAQSGITVDDRFRRVAFPLADSHSEAAFRKAVMPPGIDPTSIDVVDSAASPRRLNIVVPSLHVGKLSGGPNTALALGQVLAARGIPVNFISSDTGAEADTALLHRHLELLTGIATTAAPVTFTAGDRDAKPVVIGRDDIMLGTAWWTVQKFKHCLADLRTPRFVYLIQEFEPALYPHSTQYALAAETYTFDHLPIYNHRFLHEYFRENRIGRFARPTPSADPAEGGTWFDPVVDSRHFFYDEAARASQGRTLLFYARPNLAVRNLFEIGKAALARLAGEGAFDDGWRLHSMGERAGDIYLPRDLLVEELPWMGFEGYATRMRSCDVLLSLMLSPHPSYPPLEGAASGAIVVTNEFANKDAAAFGAISKNILAVAPTIDGVTAGLRHAMARASDHAARREASRMSMPPDWASALAGAADAIAAFWQRA